MKNAIAKLVPEFNTARMVREYAERFYVPSIKLSHEHDRRRSRRGAARSRAWKQRVRDAWPSVASREVATSRPTSSSVGEPMRVEAIVQLGDAHARTTSRSSSITGPRAAVTSSRAATRAA